MIRVGTILAVLALAGCMTPEQWLADCASQGHAPAVCEAHMVEQIRLSTPALICRPIGEEVHCFPVGGHETCECSW